MKIRTNFVSNSSSTSFTIAYRDKYKPCPTCGHKPFNIVEMLQQNDNSDNSVNHKDDDLINYIVEDIERSNNSIGEYQMRKPNDIIFGSQTYAAEIEYEKKRIQNLKNHLEELRKYKKEGWLLADISVSYHDDTMNQLIKEMRQNNQIVIFQSDDD